MEVWKPVPDCQNYEASNLGRIRSIDRIQPVGFRLHRYKGKILAQVVGNPHGHLKVMMRRDGQHCLRWVHHVVAEVFIGTRPHGLLVLHNDGDPANNRSDNLRYGTQVENMADMVKHGNVRLGSRHPCAVLNSEQVLEIRRLAASGVRQKDLGAMFGVARPTIASIVQRRSWSHLDDRLDGPTEFYGRAQ